MSFLSLQIENANNCLEVLKSTKDVADPAEKLRIRAEITLKREQKKTEDVISKIQNQIEDAIKDIPEKEAEAIKRVATQLIEYLIECKDSNVEPMMVMKIFENITEETIEKMFLDPQFDIVDFLNNPDKYVKEDNCNEEIVDSNLEIVQEQAEGIVEDIKAALEPVSPITKVLENGKVELDLNKVINTEAPVDQDPVKQEVEEVKTKAPVAQDPVRPVEKPSKENKKGKNKKDSNSSNQAHDHQCNDQNCECHGNGINWPMNISAYFDTSSLFMIKDKGMKKLVGERIARAFDNLDTLQELTNYAGDAPEMPFNFKLTGVSGKNNFVLTADRTIGGKYTKLTFTFFESGATIVAA